MAKTALSAERSFRRHAFAALHRMPGLSAKQTFIWPSGAALQRMTASSP